MTKIQPYILCGGEGKRLKPLSSPSLPKSFLKLGSKLSLFEQAANRVSGKNFNAPIAIVNKAHVKLLSPQRHIIEPATRNTAASIAVAALHQKLGAVLILPSDHIIENDNEFIEMIALGLKVIDKNDIVIFGVAPTQPSTQYGYIEKNYEILPDVFSVLKFAEKPDKKTASNYIASKNFLWNMGIFLFEARAVIELFKKYQPQLLSSVEKSLSTAKIKNNGLQLGESFSECENISFDKAIMEKVENAAIVKTNIEWHDIGSFQNLCQHIEKCCPPQKAVWGRYYIFDDIATLFVIRVGQKITNLKNKNELFFIVIEGTIEIIASNSKSKITKNESFLLPQNCEFKLLNDSCKPATIIQIEKL